jgi:hypothetical protein
MLRTLEEVLHMKLRLIRFVLLTVAVGGMSFVIVRSLRTNSLLAARTPAFVVRAVDQRTDTGRAAELRDHIHAVREDGSWVDISIRTNDPRRFQSKSLTLIPQRRYLVVSEEAQSSSTFGLSEARALHEKSGPVDPTCVKGGDGTGKLKMTRRDTLLGYDVVVLQEDTAREKRELWQTPRLGCFPLRSTTVFLDDAGRVVSRQDRQEIVATSVQLGEPAAELFVVPAGYTERSPSQMNVELHRRRTGKLPELTGHMTQQMDRNYYASRPK